MKIFEVKYRDLTNVDYTTVTLHLYTETYADYLSLGLTTVTPVKRHP